jgi:peptidoglycan/LPS O-acetylase OafA/YrhL
MKPPKALRLDIRALDGLRGIASLHIAVQHYVDYLSPGGPDLMGSGTVTLFLVLSGFVMAIGYGRRKLRSLVGESDNFFNTSIPF